jgi:predicted house-cleaning noncanonical NTP pyrophosphatase (MazG superfamily)
MAERGTGIGILMNEDKSK